MTNFYIRQSSNAASLVNTNEEQIIIYVNSNPGQTAVQIAAGIPLNQQLVDFVLETWESASALAGKPATDGVKRYYSLKGDWSDVLWANRQRARDWINGEGEFIGQNNNGNDMVAMATELGISEEHSKVLASLLLNKEGTAIVTAIPLP